MKEKFQYKDIPLLSTQLLKTQPERDLPQFSTTICDIGTGEGPEPELVDLEAIEVDDDAPRLETSNSDDQFGLDLLSERTASQVAKSVRHAKLSTQGLIIKGGAMRRQQLNMSSKSQDQDGLTAANDSSMDWFEKQEQELNHSISQAKERISRQHSNDLLWRQEVTEKVRKQREKLDCTVKRAARRFEMLRDQKETDRVEAARPTTEIVELIAAERVARARTNQPKELCSRTLQAARRRYPIDQSQTRWEEPLRAGLNEMHSSAVTRIKKHEERCKQWSDRIHKPGATRNSKTMDTPQPPMQEVPQAVNNPSLPVRNNLYVFRTTKNRYQQGKDKLIEASRAPEASANPTNASRTTVKGYGIPGTASWIPANEPHMRQRITTNASGATVKGSGILTNASWIRGKTSGIPANASWIREESPVIPVDASGDAVGKTPGIAERTPGIPAVTEKAPWTPAKAKMFSMTSVKASGGIPAKASRNAASKANNLNRLPMYKSQSIGKQKQPFIPSQRPAGSKVKLPEKPISVLTRPFPAAKKIPQKSNQNITFRSIDGVWHKEGVITYKMSKRKRQFLLNNKQNLKPKPPSDPVPLPLINDDSKKEKPKRDRSKRNSEKKKTELDVELYDSCGHSNFLFDSSFTTGADIWDDFEDEEGPLNLKDVLNEFRANIYCYNFLDILRRTLPLIFAKLEIFQWASHLMSKSAPRKLWSRSFKDKEMFPWDVFQVPVYQQFQFSTRENLERLILSTNSQKKVQHCQSFMAAILWRYFPHCCPFSCINRRSHSNRPLVAFSAKQQSVRIRARCEMLACQLSVTLLIPRLPSEANEPVKFVLLVNHNRTLAFRSSFFPYSRSKFANMAEKIGDHCPHCIVDEHVTKLPVPSDSFTLDSIRPCLPVSISDNKSKAHSDIEGHVSLFELSCFIDNIELPKMKGPNSILNRREKEAFSGEKTKIHTIMGTDSVNSFSRMNPGLWKTGVTYGYYQESGKTSQDTIRQAALWAFRDGLIQFTDIEPMVELVTRNISYMHLLPCLQHALKATRTVHGFVQLVPSDMPSCSCGQTAKGRQCPVCFIHGAAIPPVPTPPTPKITGRARGRPRKSGRLIEKQEQQRKRKWPGVENVTDTEPMQSGKLITIVNTLFNANPDDPPAPFFEDAVEMIGADTDADVVAAVVSELVDACEDEIAMEYSDFDTAASTSDEPQPSTSYDTSGSFDESESEIIMKTAFYGSNLALPHCCTSRIRKLSDSGWTKLIIKYKLLDKRFKRQGFTVHDILVFGEQGPEASTACCPKITVPALFGSIPASLAFSQESTVVLNNELYISFCDLGFS